MADEVPTIEELRGWYTPAQARQRATLALGEANAAEGVWARIRGGLIRAVGASATIQKGYTSPVPHPTPQAIPASLFRLEDKIPEKLWAGEVYFLVPGAEANNYEDTFVHAFGVRLDPAHVDREFPTKEAETPSTPNPSNDVPDCEHDKLPQKLTPEEFMDWIPATRAIAQASPAYGGVLHSAAYAIGVALRLGGLRAGAEYSGVEGAGMATDVVEISPDRWRDAGDIGGANVFWTTGILRIEINVQTVDAGDIYRASLAAPAFTFVGVRFEPVAFEKLLAVAPVQPAPSIPAPSDGRLAAALGGREAAPPPPEMATPDKPSVDRAALEAWYALYTKLYPNEPPLPHAVDSAKGFFHDKTVGRDRVHALFPARKAGKKPTIGKKPSGD